MIGIEDLTEEDQNLVYSIVFDAVKVFGTDYDAHRWASYAREDFEVANAIKNGKKYGAEFLNCAQLHSKEEDIEQIMVNCGLKPWYDTVWPRPKRIGSILDFLDGK